MKRFWEYCFYRYCQFYMKHPLISLGLTKQYATFGNRFVSTLQLQNLLFLYFLIFGNILETKVLIVSFFIFLAIVCVVLNMVNEGKYNKITYKRLEEEYKYEKNRRLKGWIVFLYWFLSTVLFFVVLFI